MKQFIITEEQIQKIANSVANIPTAQGMPIIDILRVLPEHIESKEESKEEK